MKLIRIVKLWTSLVTIEILVGLEGTLFQLYNQRSSNQNKSTGNILFVLVFKKGKSSRKGLESVWMHAKYATSL